jgi:hypothetical protein
MTVTSDPLLAERPRVDSQELRELHQDRARPIRDDRGRSDSDHRRERSEADAASGLAGIGWPRSRRILEPRRGQRLAFRSVVRSAPGYTVDAPGGQVGWVDEIRVAPFAFWPEALVVRTVEDQRLLVPVEAISRALPREQRLILREAPAGVRLVPYPRRPWHDREQVWELQALIGFTAAVGGYVAMFVALALGATLELSPVLAGLGAIGAAASGRVWRSGRRTWLAAAGLGSAWLPLVAGAILSLVWIFGG